MSSAVKRSSESRSRAISLPSRFLLLLLTRNMVSSSSLVSAALFGFALAQTPNGFRPQVQKTLEVSFNSTLVSPAGLILKKTGKDSAFVTSTQY